MKNSSSKNPILLHGTAPWLSAGEQLRQVRKELGMTQEELASRIGMHQHAIARIEGQRNHDVRLSTLRKMAEGLGCELVLSLRPTEEAQKEIERRSRALAEKLVAISFGNMAMELQSPGAEARERAIQKMQEEILRRGRSQLWKSDDQAAAA